MNLKKLSMVIGIVAGLVVIVDKLQRLERGEPLIPDTWR